MISFIYTILTIIVISVIVYGVRKYFNSKRILLLSSFLFILSCGENYVFVGRDSKSNDNVYVDKNSIKKTGEVVSLWTVVNLNKSISDKKGKINSNKAKLLIDCSKGKFKILELSTHSEDMGKGTLITNEEIPKDNDWENIYRDGFGYDIFNYVCK